MNAEGWIVTQHPDGIELECPNCHDITYHDRHHRVPGWISNIIDTHQCSYPSVTHPSEDHPRHCLHWPQHRCCGCGAAPTPENTATLCPHGRGLRAPCGDCTRDKYGENDPWEQPSTPENTAGPTDRYPSVSTDD